jgi:serine/threonine protein phosphatase 1
VGANVPLHSALPESQDREPIPYPTTGGRLIYAIGDIHGRADLLAGLLETIQADSEAARPEEPPVVITLGDYVDRGPDSRGVIEQTIAAAASGRFEFRALKGNHEEILLDFLEDPQTAPAWRDFGGMQTLLSYGVPPPRPRARPEDWVEIREKFRDQFPVEHLAFISGLELMAVYGDYAFVHAGARPGLALEAQDQRALLWIRNEFLEADHAFGKIIVHGHTPAPTPFVGPTRINVDTGAYATGVLTAVRLYGTERRFLISTAGPAQAGQARRR